MYGLTETRQRRKGPLRLLEVFTWSYMISIIGAACGWECGEPVSLPEFDLKESTVREQARSYIRQWDPDLIVLAPPCSPWSSLQNCNQRNPLQVRELRRKRQETLTFLAFSEEIPR